MTVCETKSHFIIPEAKIANIIHKILLIIASICFIYLQTLNPNNHEISYFKNVRSSWIMPSVLN